MLGDLRLRFQDERRSLEKEETNRKYAHNQFAQKLHDTQTEDTATRAEKATAKAQAAQSLADAKNDLNELETGKQADEKYLQETRAVCKQKSSDFEMRQKLRAEELEALRKAQELISSETVVAPAAAHLPALLQRRATLGSSAGASILAQVRSKMNGADRPKLQARVSSLLAGRAKDTGSQLLAAVANRAEEDPFEKVRQMITDLLARLEEEANDEANHKEWCDGELATNEKTRKETSAEASRLTSRIEELTALEATQTHEISALNDELAELAASVKEATRARTEENIKNTATIKDAKEAQAAVMQAIKTLKSFYAKAAGATSLAQQQPGAAADAPYVFDNDAAYTGMQGEKTGVIGMLEVVQSDFARLESDTSASEAAAQREYAEFSETSDMDRQEKEREARQTGFQKVRTTRDLNQAKTDLEATQEELDSALEYYEKLKPSCIGEAANYGDRKAMREAEIASLQEALKVLEGETPAPAAV